MRLEHPLSFQSLLPAPVPDLMAQLEVSSSSSLLPAHIGAVVVGICKEDLLAGLMLSFKPHSCIFRSEIVMNPTLVSSL